MSTCRRLEGNQVSWSFRPQGNTHVVDISKLGIGISYSVWYLSIVNCNFILVIEVECPSIVLIYAFEVRDIAMVSLIVFYDLDVRAI